jgi:nucleolar protein 4
LNEINGSLIDGRAIAVDWAVDKGVWEEYKKAGNTELDHENSDDGNGSDNGKGLNDDKLDGSPRDTDDDMANFMKNHLEELEDEEDDGDEDGENSDLKDGSEEDDEEYSQSLDVEEQRRALDLFVFSMLRMQKNV